MLYALLPVIMLNGFLNRKLERTVRKHSGLLLTKHVTIQWTKNVWGNLCITRHKNYAKYRQNNTEANEIIQKLQDQRTWRERIKIYIHNVAKQNVTKILTIWIPHKTGSDVTCFGKSSMPCSSSGTGHIESDYKPLSV